MNLIIITFKNNFFYCLWATWWVKVISARCVSFLLFLYSIFFAWISIIEWIHFPLTHKQKKTHFITQQIKTETEMLMLIVNLIMWYMHENNFLWSNFGIELKNFANVFVSRIILLMAVIFSTFGVSFTTIYSVIVQMYNIWSVLRSRIKKEMHSFYVWSNKRMMCHGNWRIHLRLFTFMALKCNFFPQFRLPLIFCLSMHNYYVSFSPYDVLFSLFFQFSFLFLFCCLMTETTFKIS